VSSPGAGRGLLLCAATARPVDLAPDRSPDLFLIFCPMVVMPGPVGYLRLWEPLLFPLVLPRDFCSPPNKTRLLFRLVL